MPAREKSRKKT